MKQKILGFLVLLMMAGAVYADFAQTPVYFTVATATSFAVFSIANGFNNSATTTPYPLTENYYFNSTTGYDALKNVCITGDTANCQNGTNQKPAFRYRNTGTINISIWMMFNASLPTGVLTCVNSTKPTGCGGNIIGTCPMGNLNSSRWVPIGTHLSAETPCYEKNATIYANFSGAGGGVTAIGLTHNSTAS